MRRFITAIIIIGYVLLGIYIWESNRYAKLLQQEIQDNKVELIEKMEEGEVLSRQYILLYHLYKNAVIELETLKMFLREPSQEREYLIPQYTPKSEESSTNEVGKIQV